MCHSFRPVILTQGLLGAPRTNAALIVAWVCVRICYNIAVLYINSLTIHSCIQNSSEIYLFIYFWGAVL